MDPAHISKLLRPFLGPHTVLLESQLKDISIYIDLLLKWNARINLTSLRRPNEIVTRHFGESLFAARHLFPNPVDGAPGASTVCPGRSRSVQAGQGRSELADDQRRTTDDRVSDLLDLGSGAGFPGLPIKIWAPQLRVTLIESTSKKATFLREAIRALALTDIDVFSGRAEDYSGAAHIVTLRAVERFADALLIGARLVIPGGRLVLLIGDAQVEPARQVLPTFRWADPLPIPGSIHRALLIGTGGQ